MTVSEKQLLKWLKSDEHENLEFKEAKNQIDQKMLLKYCAALANEGGGWFIAGVTDKKPRKIVGTAAFSDQASQNRIKLKISDELNLRIELSEVFHEEKRAVAIKIPSRMHGSIVQYDGRYLMRSGESVKNMPSHRILEILSEPETNEDFSAEICAAASIDDLDPDAVKWFRNRWIRKSGNQTLANLSREELLSDAELLIEGQVTYAALILLGTHKALGRHLGQSEIIFEYRSNEAAIEYQDRKNYREGFFLFEQDLVDRVNLRNDLDHFQDGLFIWDIRTFNEEVVREAILNAVAHRDYRDPGSVFVRQYPRRIEVESPGGFLPGVTPENILEASKPRNRRIAETLERCGLVERSGHGMDKIFRKCIEESKLLPDFSASNEHRVSISLQGNIRNKQFLKVIEKIGRETLESFHTLDFLALDRVFYEEKIDEYLMPRVRSLSKRGIVERRGRHYFLSKEIYESLGLKAVYTRKKDLGRAKNKELLLSHLRENPESGAPLRELVQVLPGIDYRQVQRLLIDLKKEGRVCTTGVKKSSKWHSVLETNTNEN